MEYNDVRNWIVTECSAEEIDKVKGDLKARRDILVSSIVEGDVVRVTGISPKYLNGLTGAFRLERGRRGKARGSVMLDEVSTAILKSKKGNYYIPEGAKEYLLIGIPMVCFMKAN